jgi:hypothetical protein
MICSAANAVNAPIKSARSGKYRCIVARPTPAASAIFPVEVAGSAASALAAASRIAVRVRARAPMYSVIYSDYQLNHDDPRNYQNDCDEYHLRSLRDSIEI